MVAAVSMPIFADRVDAGARLGEELRVLGFTGPALTVLGVPRGGVVVAAGVAEALQAPLGVLVARKVGAPGQPELALGAVGTSGEVVIDERLVARLDVPRDWLEAEVERVRREVEARLAALPEPCRQPLVRDRTVIVVDDGVATGATVTAAGRWLAQTRAARRVLALPVAPPETVARLRASAEWHDLVVLAAPPELHAVGQAYGRFDQVSDDEVARLLTREP